MGTLYDCLLPKKYLALYIMIILGQSYASVTPMQADREVYDYLEQHLSCSINVLYIAGTKVRNLTIKEFVKHGYTCCKKAKRGDIVFGWGADVCIFAWFFSKLFGKKGIKFFSQNLIVNGENMGLKQRIRFWLYKLALGSANFEASVNSPQLIDFYSKMFDCNANKLHLVYDAMEITKWNLNILKTENCDDKYVFFGGKAFRDVNTFVKIAKLLPEVNFRAVVLQRMITQEMRETGNIEILHDLSIEEFYGELANASVCCIPLNALVPCGVSVMQQAMLMGVPIVSTETPSMRTIIPNDEHGFLLSRGDAEGMAARVKQLLTDKSLQERVSAHAKEYMKNFTYEEVAKQLCVVLNTL